jgi:hypothetical protein
MLSQLIVTPCTWEGSMSGSHFEGFNFFMTLVAGILFFWEHFLCMKNIKKRKNQEKETGD